MPGQPWNPDEDWTENWQDQYRRPAKEEFDPLAYLGQLVPSHALWLMKLPDETRRGYVKHARELLRGFTAAEIDAAVSEIERMDAMPKMDFLPRVVARRLKAKRSARTARTFEIATGSDTISCLLCRDKGVVDVYYDHVVEAYRKGAVPRMHGGTLIEYQHCVACVCSAGQAIQKELQHLSVYRPEQQVRVVYDDLDKDMAFFEGITGPPQIPVVESLQDVIAYIKQLANRFQV